MHSLVFSKNKHARTRVKKKHTVMHTESLLKPFIFSRFSQKLYTGGFGFDLKAAFVSITCSQKMLKLLEY